MNVWYAFIIGIILFRTLQIRIVKRISLDIFNTLLLGFMILAIIPVAITHPILCIFGKEFEYNVPEPEDTLIYKFSSAVNKWINSLEE